MLLRRFYVQENTKGMSDAFGVVGGAAGLMNYQLQNHIRKEVAC